MNNRRTLLRLGLFTGGYSLTGGKLFAAPESEPSDGGYPIYQKAAEKIRPLFEKKKAPGESDWLANQHETGQTFTEYLRRVLQVAIHETGHMFGIKHCTAYECCMNGSNSLAESDRAPMVYCCECDPKLWWSCKLDPAPRAKALAEFSKRHSLEREAAQWNRIAKALGAG